MGDVKLRVIDGLSPDRAEQGQIFGGVRSDAVGPVHLVQGVPALGCGKAGAPAQNPLGGRVEHQ